MTSYFNACEATVANSNHKNFLYFFDLHFCPDFEKGSAPMPLLVGYQLAVNGFNRFRYLEWIF